MTSIQLRPRGLLESDPADVDFYNAVLGITVTQQDHLVIVDPADIDVPMTALKVVAARARQSVVVPIRDPLYSVNVPGGADSEYTVTVSNSRTWLPSSRTVDYVPHSTLGEGNLVLRATPGTIDPTREEMGSVSGPARTKLTLTSPTPGFTPIVIPPERIVQGGLEFAFNGQEGATYSVVTEYDSRPPFSLELPTVRYVLRNVNTDQVIKTIFGQAPPRDEPVELPPLTDDVVRPTLLSAPARMDTFDPAGLLTFRFSESMDPASLRASIVVRDGSDRVKGQVRISDLNRIATFVPDVPLSLGEHYTVELLGGDSGAADLAGNILERTAAFSVKTFTPRSLGVEAGGRRPASSRTPRGCSATTGRRTRVICSPSSAAITTTFVGSTAAIRPICRPIRAITGTESQQRIAALDTDKLSTLGDGKQMLLATTFFNIDRSGVLFFRATEPGSFDQVGGVILTVESCQAWRRTRLGHQGQRLREGRGAP